MYAGAARVVVSLWSVKRQSDLGADGEVLREDAEGAGSAPLPPFEPRRSRCGARSAWQAPYYWAAFTLQGEWR